MLRSTAIPALALLLCACTVQGFSGLSGSLPQHTARQTACKISMSANEPMSRRTALFTGLLGGSLFATSGASAFDFLPPALRDAARGGKREVAVEVETPPAPVEAPKPPPPKPVRAPKAAAPKPAPAPVEAPKPAPQAAPAPAPAPAAVEAAPAEAPVPKAVAKKLAREKAAKAAKEAREAAAKAAESAPPPAAPKVIREPDEDFKVSKQSVAGATGKEKFENKETLTLEEKLKKRAAEKLDAQYNKLKSDVGDKETKIPSFLPSK